MYQINNKKLWTNTPTRSIVLGLSTAMLLSVASPVFTQNGKSISGVVKDENGEPIIGASVRVAGSKTTGTVTGMDGDFKLNVPSSGTLEISYVGYLTKKVKINSASVYKIDMQEDAQSLNDVVVVGYGTQVKATLTGAVSSINNEELQITKTQDSKNLLTGKVAGVRVTQNTSEPGEFGYGNFDIRGYGGSPLIVVDGVPRGNFERLDPNEIESISVLKDAAASIYGARGGNGVILVTTKKGKSGKAKIEYSMYYGIQTPADVQRPVGAVDRMTIGNEISMRSLTDPRLTYSDEQMNEFRNGTRQQTDWYDAVMASTAPQQQHNLSISGGNDKMDYFVNFGYMDQKGFFTSHDMDYNRYNFRTNLNAQLTKNLKLGVKLGAVIDKRDRPYFQSWEVFGTLWRCVPDNPIYANNNPNYLNKVDGNITNPVAMISKNTSGYRQDNNKILSSSFDATYNIPGVKGLSLKGLFSYDNTIKDNTQWQKAYNEYTYDTASDKYSAFTQNGPKSQLTRQYNNAWSTLWQASINYDNKFGDHHVSGLVLYEESYSKGGDISASRYSTIGLPYLFTGDSENQVGNGDNITELARKAWVGRVNYDYKGRYMAEFAFRYDGSSKFAHGHQWGFFPSVSAGWRLSEESFIKNNLKFVDNLKLRASWGKMGDDSASDYQWVSGYDYPNQSGYMFNNFPRGYVFDGQVVNALGFRSTANLGITWYTIKTLNIGLDADLWNGLFGLTFEVFKRDRSGLLANRLSTVPGTFGSTLPQENLNSDQTKGIELELRHRYALGDFHYNIKGNVSLTRSKNKYLERNPSGNSYANWTARNNTNRYNDIWFGYSGSGRYGSYEQIANSSAYGMGVGQNATLPGDYIYEDWNGDGVIDDMDKHPIATTISSDFSQNTSQRNYPLLNFGLTINGDWKGLDLTMAFQGSAMSYISYGDQLASPMAWNGNALDLLMDRWHPADSKQDPYDPAASWVSGYYAYGGKTPDQNSTFAIQKGDYVRLKTLEIGYTIPRNWLSSLGVQNLRIYANAYNLFTITGVKGMDPERPAQLYGQMYPLNRSYNFGASITF